MKKYFTWQIWVSLVLLIASVATYTFNYLIFHDARNIFFYMLIDIAFLFLNVLFVVLLIEKLLTKREKKIMLKKLNMVIGAFFSEVGMELLRRFSAFLKNAPDLEKKLEINSNWKRKDFQGAILAAKNFAYVITIEKSLLFELRKFLISKRTFLLGLLENPNLLEHEQFTDVLWAVFHLTEELDFRGDKLGDLPESDYQHLALDLKRAYSQMTSEWIAYTEYLKVSYPFLFSLAARINPMNPESKVIVL